MVGAEAGDCLAWVLCFLSEYIGFNNTIQNFPAGKRRVGGISRKKIILFLILSFSVFYLSKKGGARRHPFFLKIELIGEVMAVDVVVGFFF